MSKLVPALNRRRFLHTSTAAAAAALVYPVGATASGSKEKARLAGIGVGGKGWGDITSTAAEGVVVAFCDIDTRAGRRGGYGAAAEKWPKARRYSDWRKLLDKEAKNLDGVTVSTPDHMHAPITMSAIQLGLGTYTQKPLTRTVHEARQLTLAARKHKVVTQMGNQGHSGKDYLQQVALVQSGLIGKVKEAHAWSNRPIWPQGVDRPKGSSPVPKGVDWDAWLGVAPERPYVAGVYHPFKWRGWFDFGAGALGDMGCHIIDPVVWSLDLGAPTAVQCEGPEVNDETFPKWEVIHYNFPATKYTDGDIRMTWYDGGRKPDQKLAGSVKLPSNGNLLIGEKGALLTPHISTPTLIVDGKSEPYKAPQVKPGNHYTQWSKALRGEGKTTSHFDYAGPLTETVLLGTIACHFPGDTLKWNAEALKFTNNAKANNYVHQEYRSGWEVKGL